MSTKPTYEELEKEISVLKEIEARYMGIYERSFDCIFMHDLEGNFLDANEATLKLTGYDREDIRSLNFASLLDRDQINTAREAINKLTNNLISDDLNEYKIKTKNGGYKNIEVRGSVILK